jgi:hypothetical protein
MIYCRKALGEGDHVHLAGLGSLFLVIMAAQAVIIGLGWSPETTLRRCRRSTPAATELEEREQGSQPAKSKSRSGWAGGWAHVFRARALPRAIGLLRRPRARGQMVAPNRGQIASRRPRAPPRDGCAPGGYLPPLRESPGCGFHRPSPHSPPPYPPGPLLSGTHDASRNASGLNLALENYTGEPTAPGDKPS